VFLRGSYNKEGKEVWIKTTLAQARYNKCKHLSYVLCAAFFQECKLFYRGEIHILQIKEINYHENDLNGKMHVNEDLDKFYPKVLQK
jgi:hypothetical protein